MFWVDLTMFVLLAIIISGLLTWGVGWRHPARQDGWGASITFLFLILLLAMWVGALWLPPWGPEFHGRPWVTPVLIGLFVALLILAVFTPPRRRRPQSRETVVRTDQATAVGTVFGFFFWILVVGLAFLATARYLS